MITPINFFTIIEFGYGSNWVSVTSCGKKSLKFKYYANWRLIIDVMAVWGDLIPLGRTVLREVIFVSINPRN